MHSYTHIAQCIHMHKSNDHFQLKSEHNMVMIITIHESWDYTNATVNSGRACECILCVQRSKQKA
jgi:hypothetical protein